MAKEIRLDESGWEADKKISELCDILSKIPIKNWSYDEKTGVHRESGYEFEEGTFCLRQNSVFYELSKEYKGSEYHEKGRCPIFGDGGYMDWDHYFTYSLRVSQKRKDTILVEEGRYAYNKIGPLYDKLKDGRDKIIAEEEWEREGKKEWEREGQRLRMKHQREERAHQTGIKILTNLLRRK